jgi:hypothetical protein
MGEWVALVMLFATAQKKVHPALRPTRTHTACRAVFGVHYHILPTFSIIPGDAELPLPGFCGSPPPGKLRLVK